MSVPVVWEGKGTVSEEISMNGKNQNRDFSSLLSASLRSLLLSCSLLYTLFISVSPFLSLCLSIRWMALLLRRLVALLCSLGFPLLRRCSLLFLPRSSLSFSLALCLCWYAYRCVFISIVSAAIVLLAEAPCGARKRGEQR